MKRKAVFSLVLALALLFTTVFAPAASAVLLTFETQYSYDAADPSWLTDLVLKENMDTTPGLGESVVLRAQPDYPYAETADSFREEVDRYCYVYELNETTPLAGYVFLFSFLSQNASSFTSQVSDEEVRDYLERFGVEYPGSPDEDDLVFAKALYTAMVSGSFGGLIPAGEADPAVSLDQAFIRYLSSLSGLRTEDLKRFAPSAGIASVDDYILAASRLLLWTNGYDVDADTDETEIYRLTAVMTLKNLGVSVSSDTSFEDLKAQYTAVMLGKAYDVAVDPQQLTESRRTGDAAYYILRLLGKKNGLTIRPERYTYEEAFSAVAANTDCFSLEEGEFYADIYRYTAQLKYLDSALWVYPTAYATGNEDATLVVSVNDTTVRNNYFSRVDLDPDAPEQVLKITVSVTDHGKRSLSVYYITLLQGTEVYEPESASDEEGAEKMPDSGTIISRILSRFGVSRSVMETMDRAVYSLFPSAVRSVISFIAPTFAESLTEEPEETSSASEESGTTAPDTQGAAAGVDNARFIRLLDQIGSVVDSAIVGIRGMELNGKMPTGTLRYNYVTVE